MAGKPSEAEKPPVKGVHNKGMSMPRQLCERETLQDLIQWDESVQDYFKKDKTMYPFVGLEFRWD